MGLDEQINDLPLEEQAATYEQADKIKYLRELTKNRFSPIAWWLVLLSIPKTETSTDEIISLVCKNAKEMWGNDYISALADIGLQNVDDMADITILSHEHGIIKGEISPHTKKELSDI